MKFILTLFIVLFVVHVLRAQTGVGTKSTIACKNLKDSARYALGFNIGESLAQRYADFDPDMIVAAIKDAYAKKSAAVDSKTGPNIVQNFMMQETKKRAATNKAAGEKFLQANIKRHGVVITASGLQYEVIKMGTGPKPLEGSQVKVNYSGKLINGKEFHNSNRHNGPVTMNVMEVIPGWTEALRLIPVGSKWKLFVPAELAYADSDMGTDIPAGSTLIFEIELLEIVK